MPKSPELESFRVGEIFEKDRAKVKKAAGSQKTERMNGVQWKELRSKFCRFERLGAMVEIALTSKEWKNRSPAFNPSAFISAFGLAIIDDWYFVGVLIEPLRLYAPGVFVVKKVEIENRRKYYRGLMNKCREFPNNWYRQWSTNYDIYDRRIK